MFGKFILNISPPPILPPPLPPPLPLPLPLPHSGVLYLQYGDDTKQIRMPNEITTVDTVQALFVSAFPQQLSMKMLETPSTAIYIKDDMRNMYYELSDVRYVVYVLLI